MADLSIIYLCRELLFVLFVNIVFIFKSDVIGGLRNLLELWCDNNQITTITHVSITQGHFHTFRHGMFMVLSSYSLDLSTLCGLYGQRRAATFTSQNVFLEPI